MPSAACTSATGMRMSLPTRMIRSGKWPRLMLSYAVPDPIPSRAAASFTDMVLLFMVSIVTMLRDSLRDS